MRPASSERTISAIAMNTFPRCMGSTNFSATSIISTPRRIRRIISIRRILRSGRQSVRAACCAARRATKTIRLSSRAGAESASRRLKTPAGCPKRGWKKSTTKPRPQKICLLRRKRKEAKPFFCWMNTTRMHFRTHVRESMRDKPGINSRTEYADGMIEHDGDVGKLLKALDDLGIADNTIVLYTTDNGPHQNSWPDAGTTPFRSEKNTNWEGAFRVPCLLRWPGHIKPGSVSNDIVSGLDWLPTFMAVVGDPNITDKLLKGYNVDGKTFEVHLD